MFTLGEKEQERFTEWLNKHDESCPYYDDGTSPVSPEGAIGGKITFMFTPTSIGTILNIKCACGEKVDITDYKSW